MDILINAHILINDLPASNLSYMHTQGNVSHVVSLAPPDGFAYTGYANVTVINPDGGYGVGVDVLFFSEDCIEVGTIGHGTNCTECPEGAVCPGGNRLWPEVGWCVTLHSL